MNHTTFIFEDAQGRVQRLTLANLATFTVRVAPGFALVAEESTMRERIYTLQIAAAEEPTHKGESTHG